MKKHVIGFGISAVLLLAGCGTNEEALQVEETESQVQGDSSPTEVVTSPEPQKEVTLESPYKEIKEFFDKYELPDEGEDTGSTLSYENGYTFNKETRALIGREWNEDGTVNDPTEGQKTGVIMGFLYDAAAMGDLEEMTATNYEEQMSHPISRLKQIQELTEFEPLAKWASETASLLDQAQNMEYGEERQEALKEGYDRLQKMNSIMGG